MGVYIYEYIYQSQPFEINHVYVYTNGLKTLKNTKKTTKKSQSWTFHLKNIETFSSGQ